MNSTSFSNKPEEEPKSNIPKHIQVERSLLPRLKFMGYVMYFLSISALTFALTVPKEEVIGPEIAQEDFLFPQTAGLALENDEDLLELSPTEVFNFYIITVIFAAVGTGCFLIKIKKTKALFHHNNPK